MQHFGVLTRNDGGFPYPLLPRPAHTHVYKTQMSWMAVWTVEVRLCEGENHVTSPHEGPRGCERPDGHFTLRCVMSCREMVGGKGSCGLCFDASGLLVRGVAFRENTWTAKETPCATKHIHGICGF